MVAHSPLPLSALFQPLPARPWSGVIQVMTGSGTQKSQTWIRKSICSVPLFFIALLLLLFVISPGSIQFVLGSLNLIFSFVYFWFLFCLLFVFLYSFLFFLFWGMDVLPLAHIFLFLYPYLCYSFIILFLVVYDHICLVFLAWISPARLPTLA